MNLFFLSMRPKQAARMHANIHVVKMIVETAQLLCNVHHRGAEEGAHCLPPHVDKKKIPYRESAAGHRKLGSMIWVAESLGNYRWAVTLGLALCREYNRGRGRAAGKTTLHKTQEVLEWLRDNEPHFRRVRRTKVRRHHLAMPDELKDASSSVECYRDYYYWKRQTMALEWPEGLMPDWWQERVLKTGAEGRARKKAKAKRASSVPSARKEPMKRARLA